MNHQIFNVMSIIHIRCICTFTKLTLTPIGRLKVFGIEAMNDDGNSDLNFSQLLTILIITTSGESAEKKALVDQLQASVSQRQVAVHCYA